MVEENPVMTERENILSRIRGALRAPARRPLGMTETPLPKPEDHRRVLPKVGPSESDRINLFAANAEELRARFVVLPSIEALETEMRSIRDAEGWTRIASHRGEMTDIVCAKLGVPVLLTDGGYDKNELEACQAGVTECDALIAQTGSVLVSSRSSGGRALTVLPPHHIVLARHSQLVADLPEAMALVRKKISPKLSQYDFDYHRPRAALVTSNGFLCWARTAPKNSQYF
jgi:L-lactate dehydrogenase complex protein LldG